MVYVPWQFCVTRACVPPLAMSQVPSLLPHTYQKICGQCYNAQEEISSLPNTRCIDAYHALFPQTPDRLKMCISHRADLEEPAVAPFVGILLYLCDKSQLAEENEVKRRLDAPR